MSNQDIEGGVSEDAILIRDKDGYVMEVQSDDQPPEDAEVNNDDIEPRVQQTFVGNLETAPPESAILMNDLQTAPGEEPELNPEAEIKKDRYDVFFWTGDVVDHHRGRKLYFDDGKRRIDYILAWNGREKKDHAESNRKGREIFEANLVDEGLHVERDIEEGRPQNFLKIHATWEVLTRYAEIMKIRMPMKETPKEAHTGNFWEVIQSSVNRFLSPFQLDPEQVPPVPKKFTCVFERDKEYLFKIPNQKELFFSHAQRSRIVDYILRRKSYGQRDDHLNTGPPEYAPSFTGAPEPHTVEGKKSRKKRHRHLEYGITRMISNGMYVAGYPLHEGSWKPWTKPSMRRLLYEHWAHWSNFYKVQPLDYIRSYFGEKVGLYFAWLGFYTWMLIPASIVGLIVFIYGCATMYDNVIAKESCDFSNNFTMCPSCDLRCQYWNYAVSCSHVRASHMFDNGATVFFAVFMSFWATMMLEFWKREQAGIQFKWNLLNFEEEEEPPRPEYLVRLATSKHRKRHKITGEVEPYVPFWRQRVPIYVASFSVMMFLVLVAVSIVLGVIVYRMSISSALLLQEQELLYKNASMVTTATAACINLVVIFILNFAYSHLAVVLTNWECLRTQSEYDNSLTMKLYVLQFVNYYSSIFYVAYVKGRFLGRPGKYNTFFGARQEECQAGGCLIELAIQLAIIFVGKQLIQNNLVEILLPRFMRWVKLCIYGKEKKNKNRAPWMKDYDLAQLGQRGLFNEYLEMLLQYGFVTIFVAAFPLAPLFALLNNIIEIRADANKFVTQLQRPLAAQAQNIGIWYDILYALSRIAVLSNAMIIALTSGFIHRFVYVQKWYSPDGTLKGYVNNSLSYFDVNDYTNETRYEDPSGKWADLKYCRYQGFRHPPWAEKPYKYTEEYWHIMAAQVIFIVVFENVVIVLSSALAYFIPDMPRKLREQVRREAYLTNNIILETELRIARGKEGNLSPDELAGVRRRLRSVNIPGIIEYGDEDSPNGRPPDEEAEA